jgi:ATP-dependent RNA helicase DeaD
VVATPGRLIDLIDRKAVDLKFVDYVVLDEADEMLNMGFQEDIDYILENTSENRLTWMFSATMPNEVKSISKRYMSDPFELTVGKKNQGAEKIEHHYYVTHARDRYRALKRIVDFNPDIFGIVFCRTRMETQQVAENLIKDGYNADALHGDLSQQQRDKVMKRFRDTSLQLLVATDVAARGIDVNNVTHIIHYDLPDEIENYTHRSGRTARAGKSGVSIAIVNMKETGKIRSIEKMINCKFIKGEIPDGFQVCEKQLFKFLHKVHDVKVNEKEISKYLPAINEVLGDLSREELINRFASVEFNRFLEYYRDAPNLNVESREGKTDYLDYPGDKLFINLGSMDGFDKGSMLKYIAEVAEIDRNLIGKIDVKGVYSFFKVDPSVIEKVTQSFKGEKFRSRSVRIEVSGGGGGKKKSGGSSWGGNRSDRGGYHAKKESGKGGYNDGGNRSYSDHSRDGYRGGSGGRDDRSGYGQGRKKKSYR